MRCLRFIKNVNEMTEVRGITTRWVREPTNWKLFRFFEDHPKISRNKIFIRRNMLGDIQVKLNDVNGGTLSIEDLKRLLK